MVNGQFIIPGTAENEAIRHQVDAVYDAMPQPTPEIQKTINDEILDIQVDLEMKRGFATEANLGKGFFSRMASKLISTPRSLEEQLVEAESVIGGEVFPNE